MFAETLSGKKGDNGEGSRFQAHQLSASVFCHSGDQNLSPDDWKEVTKNPRKKKVDGEPKLTNNEQQKNDPTTNECPLLAMEPEREMSRSIKEVSLRALVEDDSKNQPATKEPTSESEMPQTTLALNACPSAVHQADTSFPDNESKEQTLLHAKFELLEWELCSKDKLLKKECAAHSRALKDKQECNSEFMPAL